MLLTIFFGIPFGAAVVIALIMHFAKEQPFRFGDFIARILGLLVILIPASVVLFLGWCFVELRGIGRLNH